MGERNKTMKKTYEKEKTTDTIADNVFKFQFLIFEKEENMSTVDGFCWSFSTLLRIKNQTVFNILYDNSVSNGMISGNYRRQSRS